MLDITRELIEQYLRMTGWEPSTLGFWTRRSRQVGTFVGMTAFDIDRAIEEIATSDRLTRSALAFRLGLCAAAESLLLWASEWQLEQEEYRPGDVIDERGIGLLREAAERQLTSAGIDPRAWESARKR